MHHSLHACMYTRPLTGLPVTYWFGSDVVATLSVDHVLLKARNNREPCAGGVS